MKMFLFNQPLIFFLKKLLVGPASHMGMGSWLKDWMSVDPRLEKTYIYCQHMKLWNLSHMRKILQ